MLGSARHGTGSSPQSAPSTGTDVKPIDAPKSKISKRSPDVNASVTVNVEPEPPDMKVHAGASAKVVTVPLLSVQKIPAGSSGKQPVASAPTAKKPNS